MADTESLIAEGVQDQEAIDKIDDIIGNGNDTALANSLMLGQSKEGASADSDLIPAVDNPSTKTTGVPAEFLAPTKEQDLNEVKRDTEETFFIGRVFESESSLKEEANQFAQKHLFSLRIDGRQALVCSRASNTHHRAVEGGKKQPTRARTAQACDCPFTIHWSRKKKPSAIIDKIEALHNHPCNETGRILSERSSGKAVSAAVSYCTNMLAPVILSREPLGCNLFRRMIRPVVHPSVVLDSKTMGSIVRGVKERIDKGEYTPPPLIGLDVIQSFASVDIAGENVRHILKDVIQNAGCDVSWVVSRLMKRLKSADPYFDFRMHYDNNGQVDAVVWQTGPMRAGLQLYGRCASFDMRKSENMNTRV